VLVNADGTVYNCQMVSPSQNGNGLTHDNRTLITPPSPPPPPPPPPPAPPHR